MYSRLKTIIELSIKRLQGTEHDHDLGLIKESIEKTIDALKACSFYQQAEKLEQFYREEIMGLSSMYNHQIRQKKQETIDKLVALLQASPSLPKFRDEFKPLFNFCDGLLAEIDFPLRSAIKNIFNQTEMKQDSFLMGVQLYEQEKNIGLINSALNQFIKMLDKNSKDPLLEKLFNHVYSMNGGTDFKKFLSRLRKLIEDIEGADHYRDILHQTLKLHTYLNMFYRKLVPEGDVGPIKYDLTQDLDLLGQAPSSVLEGPTTEKIINTKVNASKSRAIKAIMNRHFKKINYYDVRLVESIKGLELNAHQYYLIKQSNGRYQLFGLDPRAQEIAAIHLFNYPGMEHILSKIVDVVDFNKVKPHLNNLLFEYSSATINRQCEELEKLKIEWRPINKDEKKTEGPSSVPSFRFIQQDNLTWKAFRFNSSEDKHTELALDEFPDLKGLLETTTADNYLEKGPQATEIVLKYLLLQHIDNASKKHYHIFSLLDALVSEVPADFLKIYIFASLAKNKGGGAHKNIFSKICAEIVESFPDFQSPEFIAKALQKPEYANVMTDFNYLEQLFNERLARHETHRPEAISKALSVINKENNYINDLLSTIDEIEAQTIKAKAASLPPKTSREDHFTVLTAMLEGLGANVEKLVRLKRDILFISARPDCKTETKEGYRKSVKGIDTLLVDLVKKMDDLRQQKDKISDQLKDEYKTALGKLQRDKEELKKVEHEIYQKRWEYINIKLDEYKESSALVFFTTVIYKIQSSNSVQQIRQELNLEAARGGAFAQEINDILKDVEVFSDDMFEFFKEKLLAKLFVRQTGADHKQPPDQKKCQSPYREIKQPPDQKKCHLLYQEINGLQKRHVALLSSISEAGPRLTDLKKGLAHLGILKSHPSNVARDYSRLPYDLVPPCKELDKTVEKIDHDPVLQSIDLKMLSEGPSAQQAPSKPFAFTFSQVDLTNFKALKAKLVDLNDTVNRHVTLLKGRLEGPYKAPINEEIVKNQRRQSRIQTIILCLDNCICLAQTAATKPAAPSGGAMSPQRNVFLELLYSLYEFFFGKPQIAPAPKIENNDKQYATAIRLLGHEVRTAEAQLNKKRALATQKKTKSPWRLGF